MLLLCKEKSPLKEILNKVAVAKTEIASSVTELWLMNQKTCISCKEKRAGTARVSGANIPFCVVSFTFPIISEILWG